MYKNYIKRLLDVCLSAIGIIILFPIFIFIGIAIKLDDPGPVFFIQKRIAKDKNNKKQFFNIYKFRTMKMSTPHNTPTHLLSNPDMYITKMGRILRKTSIDELPQIFNIFKGDMSIIGPRPALWNQNDLYLERAKYGANDIKPGLTGLAQINGRDELDILIKAKFDGYYAQNINIVLDLKCFIKTIKCVVKSKGIIEGQNTIDRGQ